MKNIEVLVVSLTSPLLVGVYEKNKKFQEFRVDVHVSDALVYILDELSSRYNIKRVIYANTPGSFMGLKVAYVMLKTFSIINNCEFFSVSGFDLNNNMPIRANKAFSFVKTNEGIQLKKQEAGKFFLPDDLSSLDLSEDVLPDYIIQAV